MTWPTTTTSTTNIDADSDSIAEARFEIFKNVKDVNSITDEFNISTPTANDLLSYNSSTSKFDLIQPASSVMGLFSFSDFPTTGASGSLTYFTGTFTKDYGSDLGITSTTDGSGHLVVTFPAGIYVLTIPEGTPAPTGTASGGGSDHSMLVRWEDASDSTTIFATLTKKRLDFSLWYYFHDGVKLNFTSDTDIKFQFYNARAGTPRPVVEYPQLTIRRI